MINNEILPKEVSKNLICIFEHLTKIVEYYSDIQPIIPIDINKTDDVIINDTSIEVLDEVLDEVKTINKDATNNKVMRRKDATGGKINKKPSKPKNKKPYEPPIISCNIFGFENYGCDWTGPQNEWQEHSDNCKVAQDISLEQIQQKQNADNLIKKEEKKKKQAEERKLKNAQKTLPSSQ